MSEVTWRAGALSILLCVAASACDSDAKTKTEAGTLSHAIDELRQVSNEQKAPALERLRALACSRSETCSLQSKCVAAYELHVKALANIEQSMRLVTAPDAGGELPALVAEAQTMIERANTLEHQCVDAQGELVRRFKLR